LDINLGILESTMNKNIFLLLLCLLCLKTEAAGCTFKMGGKKYDLSGLQAIMPTDGFQSTDSLSRMGMCGNNAKVCSGDDSFVAVFGDKALQNCVVMLARWEDPVPVPLPADSEGVVPEGIQFKLQTGDTCPAVGSQPKYEVDVKLVCDESQTHGLFKLDQVTAPCTFGATMNTKFACPSGGASSSSSGGGLSGGSIFLIILLVSVVLYFSIGAGYQYKYQEASGSELVIHKDGWVRFVDYTKLGCLVSVQFMRSKWAECRGGGDDGDTVAEDDDKDF